MFAFGDILSTEQTHNFKLVYGKSLRIMFLISSQNIWKKFNNCVSDFNSEHPTILYGDC